MKSPKYLYFVLSLLAVIFFSSAGCMKTGDGSALEKTVPTITVTGNGKVSTIPDEATVIFGVRSDNRSLNRAYRENTKKMNLIISTIKGLGIKDEDIHTSSYSVVPKYSRDEKGYQVPGKPASYQVSQKLTVRIHDLNITGSLIDKAMSSGSNTFSGIIFRSSRIDEFKEQARTLAAVDAKDKAESIANSLGVKIGRILRVTDANVPVYPVQRKAMMFSENAATPVIKSGKSEVTASCNVIFEIEQ